MRAVAALAALLFAITACSRVSGPVEIAAEDLPFDVTRTEEPAASQVTARSYALFFVEGDRLDEVQREVEADERPVVAVLRALIDGPSSEERELGVSTQVPAEVRLLEARVTSGTALVDVSGEFQEPAAPDAIALRVAQVVWTLTDLEGVDAVAFSIDGESVAVTTGDGAAVSRRVSRQDYSEFSPAG